MSVLSAGIIYCLARIENSFWPCSFTVDLLGSMDLVQDIEIDRREWASNYLNSFLPTN